MVILSKVPNKGAYVIYVNYDQDSINTTSNDKHQINTTLIKHNVHVEDHHVHVYTLKLTSTYIGKLCSHN